MSIDRFTKLGAGAAVGLFILLWLIDKLNKLLAQKNRKR